MSTTPRDYLDKAERVLADARRFVAVSPRVAAREGYMAAFHAAEALILARTGRIAKTHKGVNIAFALLARDEMQLGETWGAFLGGSYELKQQSDYAVGPEEPLYEVADTSRVIETAASLIGIIRSLLGA